MQCVHLAILSFHNKKNSISNMIVKTSQESGVKIGSVLFTLISSYSTFYIILGQHLFTVTILSITIYFY